MKTENKLSKVDPGLHWDQAYQTGKQREQWTQPSEFVLSITDQLNSDDEVLDLGCGIGVDAALIADKVHSVSAVDHAQSLIESNRVHFRKSNLTFDTVDMSDELSRFKDASFTVVYARRSLHYFDNQTTKRLFEEIHRVLKPDGRLFFECKSASDPLAGQKPETGDVHQFFGELELKEYLPDFKIEQTEEISADDFYGYPSVFLRCWASKI